MRTPLVGLASPSLVLPLALPLVLPLALVLGCGGGSGGSVDAGPLQCSLSITTKPIPTSALPLVPGTRVQLSLIDRGAPESGRGGTVTWSVSAGALETVTGHQVTWVLPTKGADYQPVNLDITATTSGLANCPDDTFKASVQAAWPEHLRALVIYNPMVAGSMDVAKKYAAFRQIADDHLCAVPYNDPVKVTGADLPAFATAVTDCIDAVGSWIAYLVPVYGVPYLVEDRIADTFSGKMPPQRVTTSLDALLVLGHEAAHTNQPLDSLFFIKFDPTTGAFPDPYPWGSLRTLTKKDFFLVSRIDGADAKAASDLIDRTIMAESLAQAGKLEGTVYVDGKLGSMHPSNPLPNTDAWAEATIAGVEGLFSGLGKNKVVADYNPEEIGFPPAPLLGPDALYYAGWGLPKATYNDVFDWKVGAIAGHLDACSACDLRGSTSWAARALGRGVTATFGGVGQAYVTGHPAYSLFFALLTGGGTFGQAAYESTPTAGWMTIFIGDPLYRPYPQQP